MADTAPPVTAAPPPLPKIPQKLYLLYIPLSITLWILTVSGVATAIYQTKSSYSERGWTTSMWRSCMDDTGTCKMIDVAVLPCDTLANLLRAARGFSVLAILLNFAQFVVSLLGFLHETVKPYISRNVLTTFSLGIFVLLLIGAGCCAALYTLPQCEDHADRMAAIDVDFVQIGPAPILLFLTAGFQLALAVAAQTAFRAEELAAEKYRKEHEIPQEDEHAAEKKEDAAKKKKAAEQQKEAVKKPEDKEEEQAKKPAKGSTKDDGAAAGVAPGPRPLSPAAAEDEKDLAAATAAAAAAVGPSSSSKIANKDLEDPAAATAAAPGPRPVEVDKNEDEDPPATDPPLISGGRAIGKGDPISGDNGSGGGGGGGDGNDAPPGPRLLLNKPLSPTDHDDEAEDGDGDDDDDDDHDHDNDRGNSRVVSVGAAATAVEGTDARDDHASSSTPDPRFGSESN